LNPDTITKLQNGDQSVFRDIVEECKDLVYNTALGITQDETEAEDITQDVFVQVYQSISSFRNDSKFSTWIYKITVRKSLDVLRIKNKKQQGGIFSKFFGNGDEEDAVHFNHPGVVLDKKESAAILFRAIEKLPENQKVAFVLHKLEGLSYQEIAEIMSVSLMAVESLQVRAKNNLKKNLQSYYENHIQS